MSMCVYVCVCDSERVKCERVLVLPQPNETGDGIMPYRPLEEWFHQCSFGHLQSHFSSSHSFCYKNNTQYINMQKDFQWFNVNI